jgi:hypothetical protein
MTMIEKVGKALVDASILPPLDPPDSGFEAMTQRAWFHMNAVSLVKALDAVGLRIVPREPTDIMAWAGVAGGMAFVSGADGESTVGNARPLVSAAIWRAMIDAALKEGE